MKSRTSSKTESLDLRAMTIRSCGGLYIRFDLPCRWGICLDLPIQMVTRRTGLCPDPFESARSGDLRWWRTHSLFVWICQVLDPPSMTVTTCRGLRYFLVLFFFCSLFVRMCLIRLDLPAIAVTNCRIFRITRRSCSCRSASSDRLQKTEDCVRVRLDLVPAIAVASCMDYVPSLFVWIYYL